MTSQVAAASADRVLGTLARSEADRLARRRRRTFWVWLGRTVVHRVHAAIVLVQGRDPEVRHDAIAVLYPFTAPKEMPRTRYRCSMATAMKIGTVPSTDMAAILAQKFDCPPK